MPIAARKPGRRFYFVLMLDLSSREKKYAMIGAMAICSVRKLEKENKKMETQPSQPPTSAKADSTKSKANASKAGNLQVEDYKTSIINPLWATEVAKSYDLTGNLAEKVADALGVAVEKHLAKVTKREKLNKLVMAAIAENIGREKP